MAFELSRWNRPLARLILAAIALVIVCHSDRSWAAAPCLEAVQCRATMTVEGHFLTLYASAPIDKPQPQIRRALIMVHGTDGNVESYYRTAIEATRLAGKLNETLVIAPRFVERGHHDQFADEREFIWTRGADWRAGDLSNREVPPRVSSFDLMNRLLARLADAKLFPDLSTIVLAGHSAGGQFVQRYAIGQAEDPKLVQMLFVVANPSSYLYLDGSRPDPDNPGGFAPFDRGKCQANLFKYGFEKLNAYFKEQLVDEMTARYRARTVVYLLGESDTDPNAANLSRTCAAMAQGETRFARGKAFMAYMDRFYRPHDHRMVIVPGVGHSARGMFQSPRGLAVLFE